MPNIVAAGGPAANRTPSKWNDGIAFARILIEPPPAGTSRPNGIECFKPSGVSEGDELCVDWNVSLRVPFSTVRAVEVTRQELPREIENLRREMEGLPQLPSSVRTVSYFTALTIELNEDSIKAYKAFADRHKEELFALWIGGDDLPAVVLRPVERPSVIRIRFLGNSTSRFRRVFAPLGDRLVVREQP